MPRTKHIPFFIVKFPRSSAWQSSVPVNTWPYPAWDRLGAWSSNCLWTAFNRLVPFSIVLRNLFFFPTFNAAALWRNTGSPKMFSSRFFLWGLWSHQLLWTQRGYDGASLLEKAVVWWCFCSSAYLFVRVNSTVCTMSTVKSCK